MVLLDTCAIIWDALEPSKLSKNAKRAIEKAYVNRTLIISDISIWILKLTKIQQIELFQQHQ